MHDSNSISGPPEPTRRHALLWAGGIVVLKSLRLLAEVLPAARRSGDDAARAARRADGILPETHPWGETAWDISTDILPEIPFDALSGDDREDWAPYLPAPPEGRDGKDMP